jgi:hypothetical protein
VLSSKKGGAKYVLVCSSTIITALSGIVTIVSIPRPNTNNNTTIVPAIGKDFCIIFAIVFVKQKVCFRAFSDSEFSELDTDNYSFAKLLLARIIVDSTYLQSKEKTGKRLTI